MKKSIFSISVLMFGILIGSLGMYMLMEQYRVESIKASRVGEMSADLTSYLSLLKLKPGERGCKISQLSHMVAKDLENIHISKGFLYKIFVPSEIPAESFRKQSLEKYQIARPVPCA